MRIQEVMSTGVETASSRESADRAWERMRERKIHHLVVTESGKVAGVLSDRDLGGPGGAAVRAGRTVADLMTTALVTAGPRSTIKQAANLLRGRSVGCLPVFDGGKLVGIVTVSDLLELLGRGVERPVATTRRWVMKDRGPRRRPGMTR